MATKLILNRARVTLVMCLVVAIPLGCDTGTPSHTAAHNREAASAATPPTSSATSSPTPGPSATSSTTAAPSSETASAGDTPAPDLAACHSQQTSGVTRHHIATLTRGVGVNGPLQVVVSRTGTATVAWLVVPGGEHYSKPNYVAAADDPRSPGDPHHPPRPPDAQNPLDAQYDEVLPADQRGESLAIDGEDVQTLIWFEDLLTPPGPNQDYTELYDVVASDRVPGAGWSSPPRLRIGFVSHAPLAVNTSGAAVVAWWEIAANGKSTYTYASYRSARGAGWTPATRVPHAQISESVGIDDAGRILLLYLPVNRQVEQVIRRTATGGWGKPQPVTSRDGGGTQLAVGADGAALVTYSTGDYPHQTLFTRRMSPAGHWGAPVRQPGGHAVGPQSVDVDARGRALIAWWNGTNLLARWSEPSGRWLKTCVLAAGGSKQRSEELNPQVVVNRRGDALVVWRVSGRPGRVGQLWARYQRAGHAWGKPIKVTPADSPPRGWFAAGLGEGGVGAVAWTTRDNHEIQVQRLSPTQ